MLGLALLAGIAVLVMFLSDTGVGTRPSSVQTAPPARTLSTLLDLQGNGIKKSGAFTVQGQWLLGYAYDCSSFLGGSGNFIVSVYDTSGGLADIAVNLLGAKGSDATPMYKSGTFYLEMNSECAWRVIVKG